MKQNYRTWFDMNLVKYLAVQIGGGNWFKDFLIL